MSKAAALSLREALRGFTRQKSISACRHPHARSWARVCLRRCLRPLWRDAAAACLRCRRRLVVAWAGYEGGPSERDSFTEQAVVSGGSGAQAFDGVAGFRYTQFTLLQRGEPTDLQGAMVSPEFFSVLSVRAELGAAFTPSWSELTGQGRSCSATSCGGSGLAVTPAVAGQPANLGGEILHRGRRACPTTSTCRARTSRSVDAAATHGRQQRGSEGKKPDGRRADASVGQPRPGPGRRRRHCPASRDRVAGHAPRHENPSRAVLR